MTYGLNMGERVPLTNTTLSDQKPPVPEAILTILDSQASTLRLRRGQSLSLSLDGAEAVFIVRSGTLILDVTLPQGLRQVVALLFPGDVLRTRSAPSDAASRLLAVSAGEALRLRWSAFARLAAGDSSVARYFEDAVAKQTACQAIHVAALGRFDCEQKVATFLLELVLRTGARTPCGGLEFDMPLSRTDMADYLGLNADTLSRTMSRLRASGVIGHPARNRAMVRDVDALAALTPAARPLMALCGEAGASA